MKGFAHNYDQFGEGHLTPLPLAILALGNLCGMNLSPSRVILGGWSEGCQGVRTQLNAGENPDAVCLADGTHSELSFPPERVASFRAYANAAKGGSGAFLASCSAIVPGTYASTRATLEKITGFAITQAGPVTDPVEYRQGQCVVYACTGQTAADHIDQGQILLPRMLGEAFSGNFARARGNGGVLGLLLGAAGGWMMGKAWALRQRRRSRAWG